MLCPKIRFPSSIDALYTSSEDGKGVGRLTPEPPARLVGSGRGLSVAWDLLKSRGVGSAGLLHADAANILRAQ